jgi:hypothetical protein
MKASMFPGLALPLLLGTVLLSSLLLGACDNTFGVFNEIQSEKLQEGTDIFLNKVVKAVGDDGTNYYAAMAKLYYRPVSGGSWKVMPVNGDSDYYCAGFAAGAGVLYVATADSSSATATKGVFTSTDSGSTWTRLDDGDEFKSQVIDAIFLAGGSLYVASHTGDENASQYDLDTYDTGTSAFVAAGIADSDTAVTAVVREGAGSGAWWAITADHVYTSATQAGFAIDAAASGPAVDGRTPRGLAADHLGRILVTTGEGYLYTRSGGTWSKVLLDDEVPQGIVFEAPLDSGSPPAGYRILVAKHDATYGYYEFTAGGTVPLEGNDDNAVYAPTPSAYTTAVYMKPVIAFHYSQANGKMFIGLAAQGRDSYALYSNSFSGGEWSGWTAE